MICEFCLHYTSDNACNLGLNKPKGMTCREFGPGLKKFCSEPKDFVSPAQIVEMAVFFGFQRTELKKVKLMAAQEEKLRQVAEN